MPQATEYTEKLYQALCDRGIVAQLEYNDGYKTVDIAVLDAHLYIEVDGIQHFTNPKQIARDFMRQHYSEIDGFRTFYVTNQIIQLYTEEVADAIADLINQEKSASKVSSLL